MPDSTVHLSVFVMVVLGIVGFVAGFVDAIAGGGGVLTTPALLIALPATVPAHWILGTSKGQAVFGSGVATVRYAHSPLLNRRRAWISFVPGLVGAVVGVELVSAISPAFLRPLILILLACVAVFMAFYRPPKVRTTPPAQSMVPAVVIALLTSAYDGFFGPGTGTFLILAFVLVYHDSLDAASANAKVVNFASNLSALIVFMMRGCVVWQAALPMAAGQAIGGYAGAHMTIRKGREFVRYVAVGVSLLLMGWVAWKWWQG